MSVLIWSGRVAAVPASRVPTGPQWPGGDPWRPYPEDEQGLAPWARLRNELARQRYGFTRGPTGYIGNPALTHTQARQYATEGFQAVFGRAPSLCEVQFMQGVAWLESNYGAGWGAAGAGSNNMGAIQAGKPPCGPGTFLYTDSHPTSSGQQVSYEVCFRAYPTPQAGFVDLAKVLYKQRPTVLAAAGSCDIKAVSTTMYDSHYYEAVGATREARIAYHVKALTGALKTITKALKEPMPAGKPSSGAGAGASAGGAIALVAAAGAAIWLISRMGRAA